MTQTWCAPITSVKSCLSCWLKITSRGKIQNRNTNEEAMREDRRQAEDKDRRCDTGERSSLVTCQMLFS